MPRRRKVRFIEPQGRTGRPFNAWIARWPLLGPITLATILHNRGCDSAVYNENISGPLPENPAAFEDVCSADVVGISIMTPTASRGYHLARQIKLNSPKTTVALGGVHASFLPHEAIAHGDVVVVGEGESVIEELAAGRIRSGIVKAEPLANIDAIPTLNYSLMTDFDKLLARAGRKDFYQLPVMTSRGCPHSCTYCSVTRMFGRKVRRQSVDKVCRDLESYVQQGFRHVFFYDDNLTADRDWAKLLMEKIRPLRISFNAQTRVDFHWLDRDRSMLDHALLEAMRRGGADVLYIGYETTEEAAARKWHKGYQGRGCLWKRLMEDTHILRDKGFWIHGMFMLGPEHTQATANRIVSFARQSGMESMQISILTPVPGTPLYQQMRPNLVLTDYPTDWDFYDGAHCVYNNSRLGLRGLQETVLEAHRRFYRWGGWSIRRIRSLIQQRGSLADKLGLLWANARTARTTLQEWQNEIRAFLEMAKARRLEFRGA